MGWVANWMVLGRHDCAGACVCVCLSVCVCIGVGVCRGVCICSCMSERECVGVYVCLGWIECYDGDYWLEGSYQIFNTLQSLLQFTI